MADVNSSIYWTEEFVVTRADLNRLAAFIDFSGQAQHLSTLAKRVVSGRLRHGPEHTETVSQLFGTDITVKLWDPAGVWQVGDHVIVLRRLDERMVAFIGEVQEVNLTNNRALVFIPEEKRDQGYALMSRIDPRRQSIMANIKHEIARKREKLSSQTANDAQVETVEIIILEYGERITGLLLQALREDERFVLLDGRYFLRSLAIYPLEPQLRELAWLLLTESNPLTTIDLLARIPDANGDTTLFGLYLALRQHPERFANTQPGKRPLWTLAGPPPGPFTPQHASYDPESYEILCLPGTDAPPKAVVRLWETELLAAVV